MISQLTRRIPLTAQLSWILLLRQCAYGCAAISAFTLIAYKLHFQAAAIGFVYLLAVVIASLIYGIWQAILTSLFAVLCLNYFFIPPTLSLSISNERDWILLASFQVCALLASRIFSPEHRLAREANSQRIQMRTLYELSRGILLFDLHEAPGPQLVELTRRVLTADDVAIYDAEIDRLDHEGDWPPEEQRIARTTYLADKDVDDKESCVARRIIHAGAASVGAMVIHGDVDPLIASAAASLAAIAFERFRSYEKRKRAESTSQTEQLRVAVLDALAHAFKTPLTVIRTASCGLMELDTLDSTSAELAKLIDEESVNLNHLCTRLLQTAKLEASSVTLRTEPVIVSRLVKDVLSELSGTLKGRSVELSIEEQSTPLQGDRELLKIILAQYLDNAAKYSAPETPIAVTVRESNSELLLSVRNQGPLIRMQDRERVFERFYRGEDAKARAPGTGVGLAIVKKAAEAHHGHVWVISAEEEGTTFFLSMPKLQVEGDRQWNQG